MPSHSTSTPFRPFTRLILEAAEPPSVEALASRPEGGTMATNLERTLGFAIVLDAAALQLGAEQVNDAAPTDGDAGGGFRSTCDDYTAAAFTVMYLGREYHVTVEDVTTPEDAVRTDNHSASRRLDVLELEAPHLIASPADAAGYVELVDGSELAVRLGDPIVFDPTGRDLIRCAVVGIAIDCDEEAQEPGERPAPIVRVNDTADAESAEIIVVRRAFAVLTAGESS